MKRFLMLIFYWCMLQTLMAQLPTPRGQQENLTLTNTLKTDSCAYHPGSTVKLSYSSVVIKGARVRYMHLGEVIDDQPLTSRSWTWTVPAKDYQGYLAQVYVPGKTEGEAETVRGTIAIDVSSDWKRFPRYGFVASFGGDKTVAITKSEMEWLNRCHINGVQFQDWHYKHHWPWGGKDGQPMTSYKDIANRTVYTSSVKNYIKAQHDLGMKSIFYNLCFGALDDAAEDGVGEQWYLFKDKSHTQKDYHGLPSDWKSDIYLVDPANAAWLAYLGQRNDEVYDHLDFDGFQIDQLGYRGTLYRYNGSQIDLPAAYATFIKSMKQHNPGKRLIMNAVGNYGGEQIAKTGQVDMHYDELWAGEAGFKDLYTYVTRNAGWTNDTVKTVFAAYMNYECNNRDFNTPGVLLTDAVMFALGGSHLELGGDHMLCREYFPYAGCTMSSDLKKRITTYYDFHVAYQNILRDGGTLSTSSAYVPTYVGGDYTINAWEPKLGGITSIARLKDNMTVVHLLNFITADQLSWRDLKGTMPKPKELKNMQLQFTTKKDIKHVYTASPDYLGGAMQELDFTLEDGKLTVTLPSLNYWSMLVLAEEKRERQWELGESVWAIGNLKAEGTTRKFSTSYTSIKLDQEADGTYQGVIKVVQDSDNPGSGYGRVSFFNGAFNSDWKTGRLGPIADHTALKSGRTDYAAYNSQTEWLVPVGTWHFTLDPFRGTALIQPVGKAFLGDYVYVLGNVVGIGWTLGKDATRLYRTNDGKYGGTATIDGAGEITLFASTKTNLDSWTNKRIGGYSTQSKPMLSLNAKGTVDYGFDRGWTCSSKGTFWMEYDPEAGSFLYKRLTFYYAVGSVEGVDWNPTNTSVRLTETALGSGIYQGMVTLYGEGDLVLFSSTRQNVESSEYWKTGRISPMATCTPAKGEWQTALVKDTETKWTGIPAGTYLVTYDTKENRVKYEDDPTAIDGIPAASLTTDAPAYDLSGRPASAAHRGIRIQEGRKVMK